MRVFNNSDIQASVELIGDAGNLETLRIQPRTTVWLPEGFTLSRPYKNIRVLDEVPPSSPKEDSE